MQFDLALPTLVSLAFEKFDAETIDRSIFLRDARGKISLILRDDIPEKIREEFDDLATERLGAYVDQPSATPEELFDDALATNAGAVRELVFYDNGKFAEILLLDRQIIGQDWARPNFVPINASTPVLTFFSCKGGVGRSTALAIVASDLSERGKNVMIVDLDLEAPGIGSILLGPDDLPELGVLDYLIESRMDGLSDSDLETCLAPSPLTAGRGLIEIMPALGSRGHANPAEVLPKLGRAYLDRFDEDGNPISYLSQVRELIAKLDARGKSDVILVDARAGLSEASAPAVIGLGGDVLLFGVSTPQTIECYSYLLSHLARFAPQQSTPVDDWRLRLRMVHAKAGRTEEDWRPFRENCYEKGADRLYEEDDLGGTVFNFDIDDPEAPHYPWPIPFDVEYAEFDPTVRRTILSREFYDRTFGSFTARIFGLLFPSDTLDE